MSNRRKAFLYMALAVLLYAIPLAVWVIINREMLIKHNGTAVSFLVILAVLFFLVFAKKAVKAVVKKTTPMLLGSAIVLVLAIGMETIASQLTSFGWASVLGAVLAWLPFQLSAVYSQFSRDKDGNALKGMTLKQAIGEVLAL